VAQPGSALAWGARGRRFKSYRPDQLKKPPQKKEINLSRGGFFMSQIRTVQSWTLASVALLDAYTDFILSRQAMNAKKQHWIFITSPLESF
jgi:hypothetical protein